MIAGGGKLLHIEALASKRLRLEALAVEARLAMQARPIVIEVFGRPKSLAGKASGAGLRAALLAGRLYGFHRCLLARRPDSERGLAQQQAGS